MKRRYLNSQVRDFVKANDKWPVVEGFAIAGGGKGGLFTLSSQRIFKLTAEECRALPAGYPKWRIGP